jgi:hypothetical protein
MPILRPSLNLNNMRRWRPDSPEYYASIVSTGNSISEEYPKKCYKEWKPPKQFPDELVDTSAIPAAGRARKIPKKEFPAKSNTSNTDVPVRAAILEEATKNGSNDCKYPRMDFVGFQPAGLRVSRVLPYPII